MPDKRFDSTPKVPVHMVRTHSRKIASGRQIRVREYMRQNPGGWSTTSFAVTTPPHVWVNDNPDYVKWEDRYKMAEDVLLDNVLETIFQGDIIVREIKVTDEGMVDNNPDMREITVKVEASTRNPMKDTVASVLADELETVFGYDGVAINTVDQMVGSEEIEMSFHIFNQEV